MNQLHFRLGIFQCSRLNLFRRLLFAVFPLQKFLAGNRINRINQRIVQINGQTFGILLGFFQFRLQNLGRSAGNRLLTPVITFKRFLLDFGVDGNRGFAVKTVAKVFNLAGNHLVALIFIIEKNVVDRLDAHNLAGRGHQRNLPQIFSDPRQFGKNIVEFVEGIHFS